MKPFAVVTTSVDLEDNMGGLCLVIIGVAGNVIPTRIPGTMAAIFTPITIIGVILAFMGY